MTDNPARVISICTIWPIRISLREMRSVCYQTSSMGDDVGRRDLALKKLLRLAERNPKAFEALERLVLALAESSVQRSR